jgi:hypothetical protein
MPQTGSGYWLFNQFEVKKNEMGCLPGPGTALLGRRNGVKGGSAMRRGRYVVVLASVGVLAAGCGTKAQPDNLTAAVTRTAGQTARMTMTMTTQMQSMSVSYTVTGEYDFVHSRGMISMQSPMAMTEIFISPTAYIKLPGGTGKMPGGKSWIALGTGTSDGLDSSLLGPFGGTDPADLLASLTAVSASVRSLGPTTIRGVKVTGFRVDIDPARAAARIPSRERAGLREFIGTLGSGPIPVDVWVDSQNLVRRVKLSLHLPDGEGGPAKTQMVEVTDFYDFGVPVRVSPPPPSQTASMSQLIKSGFTESGGSAAGSSGPPQVSGTLSATQSAAAERAVTAFWSALGRNKAAAVARTVPPAQRSCVRSFLSKSPKITVASLRIVSAQPAGKGAATVRFTVKAQASLDGQNIPVFPQGPGGGQWLVTTRAAGHWYVNLDRSTALVFSGACPG